MTRLVFIVGCPRSGTTLLLDLLRAHPDAVHVTQASLGMAPDDTGTRETDVFNRIESDIDIRRRFKALTSDNQGKVLVEKTPFHTLRVPRIRRVFPQARVLSMLRDPRDNALSLLAGARSMGWAWAPRTFEDALRFWRQYLPGTLSADAILRYEAAVPPLGEATREVERARRIVFAHEAMRAAGLPAENGMVYEIAKSTLGGANVSDMREGVYRRGVSGEWREALTDAQKARALEIVGDDLKRLGYEEE